MDFRERMNAKWRKQLFKICVFLAAMGSIAEIGIYLYDSRHRTLFLPLNVYRARFIYIPSSLNLLVIIVTYFCLKSKRLSNRSKNIWACLLIYFLCANTQVIHYVYGPLLMLPCIAIFITILFTDRRLALGMLILSYISLALAGHQAAIELRKGDEQLPTDLLLAVVVLFASFVGAWLLIGYVSEQMNYILASNERQKRLIEECNIDLLMGIGNRRRLDKRLNTVVDGEYGEKKPQLLMLDIDNFKLINDTYGHMCGDDVLIALSCIIKDNIEKKHIEAFRYGGEEIMLLFFCMDSTEVFEIAEKIRIEFLKRKFSFDLKRRITFSGGIAEFVEGMSEDEWIKVVDENLYKAKDSGKNRIIVNR